VSLDPHLTEQPLYVAQYPLWVKGLAIAVTAFFAWGLLIEGYFVAWLNQGISGVIKVMAVLWVSTISIPEFCVSRVVFLGRWFSPSIEDGHH
jgi:hypothetical protein